MGALSAWNSIAQCLGQNLYFLRVQYKAAEKDVLAVIDNMLELSLP